MGLLSRFFSFDYRKALAAEAEGDYLSAARYYSLAGHTEKVADMHLAQARCETSYEGRTRSLRAALSFAEPGDSRRSMILRLLGRALKEHAEGATVTAGERRELLAEAAGLLEEGESFEVAGECHLAIGERARAAAAFARAGLVERVEQVLGEQEQAEGRARREDSLFQDYELHLQGGQRDEAAEALRGCIEAAGPAAGEYRRLLAELEAKLLTGARIELELEGARVIVVGRFPLVLGREADCDLQARGTSVSRRHARILLADREEGGFRVEDAGSRNGTQLNGLPLGAPIPLPAPAGRIGLGEGCELGYRVIEPAPLLLALEVTRGLDLGRRLIACPAALALERVIPGAPPVELHFARGRPFARALRGELQLNGARVSTPVQLVTGDRLVVEDRALSVVG